MAQILLIENNIDLSKVIKLNLMKAYDFSVIEKNNLQEGIELIDILPNIELILVREHSEEQSILESLVEYLKNKSVKIPLIVVGKTNHSYDSEFLIEPTSSWRVMIDLVGKILKREPFKDLENSKASFLPIPLVYFLNITETSIGCDVYIRVKKGENDFQYIKRLNSTDNFARSDIEKYQAAGLMEFYVPKEHFTRFVDYVTDKLTLKLSDTIISPTKKIQLSSEVFEVSKDRILALGIDERTIQVVEENVKFMQKTLGERNALADYLNNLKKNTMSYSYSHSYLACLLLNKILKSFEWESASVREKISYICYFHDISLKEDSHTRVNDDAELKSLDLGKDATSLIMNHANKSAEIVDQFPQVPIGVSSLIREHHGVKTGVGFRTNLSINLSPVSMMFIVVEEFVHEFLKLPEQSSKEDIAKIFTKLEPVFNKTTYSQTIAALKVAILSSK
jgi:hypothetical protein